MNKDTFNPILVLIAITLTVGGCGDFLDSRSESPSAVGWEGRPSIESGNESTLSDEQQKAYQLDAERLAVRLVNKTDSTQTEIPAELVGDLYNGFVHIVNSDHPKTEEPVSQYPIHTRVPAHPRSIVVYADTSAPWIDAWRNGQTQTGNSTIDQLLNEYNFELTEYNELESSDTALAQLLSTGPINGYAVGKLFEDLNEVENAGPDVVTDGNEINILIFEDHLRYFFELRFGDCPSGCINSHFWIFKVYPNGSVSFEGEAGDSLDNYQG